MSIRVVETFYSNDSWVCPAGVTNITVRSVIPPKTFFCNLNAAMIDTMGNAYAWGANTQGQLGVGDVTARSSPVAVVGGFFFKNLYQGEAPSNQNLSQFALDDHGKAYAWGSNGIGQLGVGDVTARSSPVAVLGGFFFATLAVSAFSGNQSSVIGVSTGGKAYGWGTNTNGQLGLGDVTHRSSPVAVLGGLLFQDVISDDAGSAFYGLTFDGTLYAWGKNVNGQLGVGDVTPRSSPVAVLGGLTFKKIFCSGTNTTSSCVFGLTTGGVLYGWGANGKGQLGVGNTTPRSSPVAVLGGLTFNRVFVINNNDVESSVLALTGTGKAYSWGGNALGSLGLGDLVARSSPVAVLGGFFFDQVFSGTDCFFGLATTGTLYSWGGNVSGQLGVGDVIARSSPVAVLGGLTFVRIDSAQNAATTDAVSVLGTAINGAVYGWGRNANGQLGLGDIVDRSSPVAVLGGLGFNYQASYNNVSIQVIPGASYAIKMGPVASSFGNVGVGGSGVSKMVLEYFN